jgi:5-aminopentanamidase
VPTNLRVALVQLDGHGRDRDANLATGLRACREAAAQGAHLVLFPELWSIAYVLEEAEAPEDLQRHGIAPDDGFLEAFGRLAAELDLAIAVTYLQRWPEAPRDVVALFDRRGALALEYAKVHTCDFGEEAALTPGNAFPVCDLDTAAGPVRVGAMICFDILFPEAARVLMLEGAELILVPNASDADHWRIAVLQTRAIENMVAVAMANYPRAGMDGRSCAFDPIAYPLEGEGDRAEDPTVVRAGRGPGIYLADFDLERIRTFRMEETQGDAYRKPAAYGPIVGSRVRRPFVRPDARR